MEDIRQESAVRALIETYMPFLSVTAGSFGSRLRSLFWFSVTNFVLPGAFSSSSASTANNLTVRTVPLYAVQFVLAITNTHSLTYGVMLFFANFTSVICVAFATSTFPPLFSVQ
jgi:hypothetical protein